MRAIREARIGNRPAPTTAAPWTPSPVSSFEPLPAHSQPLPGRSLERLQLLLVVRGSDVLHAVRTAPLAIHDLHGRRPRRHLDRAHIRHDSTLSNRIEIRHAFGTEEFAAAHLAFADGHANPATGLIFTP